MVLDCLLGVNNFSFSWFVTLQIFTYRRVIMYLNALFKQNKMTNYTFPIYIYSLMISKAKMSHVKINLYIQADADTPIRLAINGELILSTISHSIAISKICYTAFTQHDNPFFYWIPQICQHALTIENVLIAKYLLIVKANHPCLR